MNVRALLLVVVAPLFLPGMSEAGEAAKDPKPTPDETPAVAIRRLIPVAAGIDVYIVTASLKQVVEVFAGEGFGYNVPADHVLGMELEVRNRQLQPAYKAGWVQTHHQGKVEAIRIMLGARGEPVFAAGDSDGDYEMLSGFAGTQLALILNRVKGGKVGTLCRRAVEQQDQARPRYLSQGRDENTGIFLPAAETIRLGQSQPQLLK